MELFYQQILDLKIAGISASELEQEYQSKLLGGEGEPLAHSLCCLQLNSAHSFTFTKKGTSQIYPEIHLEKMFCLGKEPSHNSLQKGKAQYTYHKLLAASLCQTNLPPNPAGVLLGQTWVRSAGEQAVPITLWHTYSMGGSRAFVHHRALWSSKEAD